MSRHQRRFHSRSASSSSQPPAWATESSRWHSHGVHAHHVAWRLGCFERNIAPAWDCACRHETLIAPARLKPLILPLFRRAWVVFLSRRPSNTQHSGAQGRCFFHGGYEHAAQWRAGAMFLSRRLPNTQHSGVLGDVSFTVRPQPRHTSGTAPTVETTERRHAKQAHEAGPVIIHRPRFVCVNADAICAAPGTHAQAPSTHASAPVVACVSVGHSSADPQHANKRTRDSRTRDPSSTQGARRAHGAQRLVPHPQSTIRNAGASD